MGVWRCRTRLCVGAYGVCSLPQVRFCSGRIVCEIKKMCLHVHKRSKQFVLFMFNGVFFLLCCLFGFDVGFWAGLKSEVSQPQPKLYTRPFEAAWTDFHPASFTGASRCSK